MVIFKGHPPNHWEVPSRQRKFTTLPLLQCNGLFSEEPLYKILHTRWAIKQVISQNMKMIDLGKDFPNNENIMVEQRSDTLPMGEYWVVYKGKEHVGVNTLYTIEYFTLNQKTGIREKQFELKPVIQINARMGNVAEPATKHFLTKDIYTHLTYYVPDENENGGSEWQEPKIHNVSVGDTFMLSNSMAIVQGLNKDIDKRQLQLSDSDIAVGARLLIQDINNHSYEIGRAHV